MWISPKGVVGFPFPIDGGGKPVPGGSRIRKKLDF